MQPKNNPVYALVAETRKTINPNPPPCPFKSGRTSVTPATAREWLTRNSFNRPIRPTHVRGLADQMTRGLWIYNGDVIRFSKKGVLFDGQHRLLACILSDTSFECTVDVSLSDEAYRTIDQTRAPRNANDLLAQCGYKAYTVLATATRWAIAYEQKRLRIPAHTRLISQVSAGEILDFVSANPSIAQSADITHGSLQTFEKILTPSLAAFVHWKVHGLAPNIADRFVHLLSSDAGLHASHPLLVTRERLLHEKTYNLGTSSTARGHPMRLLAITIRGWNAWINNETTNNYKLGARMKEYPAFEDPKAVPLDKIA